MASLEAGLIRDPPAADQVGEMLVQRVHPVRGTRLHGGVDLVRLALADEVADRGAWRRAPRSRPRARSPPPFGTASGRRFPAGSRRAGRGPAAAGAAGTRR